MVFLLEIQTQLFYLINHSKTTIDLETLDTPRGSSGYGTKFRQANIKDWDGMDYQDLMSGVDAVVKMGVADENRLGVMGWSYGGFMTSWIRKPRNLRQTLADVSRQRRFDARFNSTRRIRHPRPDCVGL